MILKKLKIKNIRSYKETEIEFPTGSLLLSGDIGSGKTSILLALQFALFGLQPGQKGASILRQSEEEAYVSLEFEIDENNLILERTLKRTKNSITQDKNIITVNNVREELSTSEMKTRVIDLLNYPKEFAKKSNLLYKFTVYTPQEEMKSIIEERPETRLDTLRHIFGVDRYKRISENTSIFLQKLREQIRIHEVEVKQLNELKEKLTEKTENKIKLARETNNLSIEFNILEEKKKKAEQDIDSVQNLINEKNKIDSEISQNKIKLQGKKDIQNRLEKEIFSMQQQTKEEIEFSPERLKQTAELLEKHRKILDDLNSKYMAINSRISVLNSKKEDSQKMKQKIISMENCPTCFQKVASEHKERISKRTNYDIEDVDREMEQKQDQKNQVIKDIEKEKQLISGYEEDKSQLEKDKIKFEHQKTIQTKIKSDAFILDRTKQEIEQIQKQIESLSVEIEKYKETEKQFQEYKENFNKINQEVREKEINLAQKNKELELLKTQIEEIKDDIKEKEKIKEKINYLKQLQSWLQDSFLSMITLTEKNVLAKLRSEFSKIFNEWFTTLVSNNLSVRLDEDFTPIITNKDYDIDYDFLSGGERTAVALAYRLALNHTLNSLLSKIKTKDLLILDEPTDGFSAEQLDKMRDIFEQLKTEQTILVSHEQKIEGFVDHVIRIRKDIDSLIEKTV